MVKSFLIGAGAIIGMMLIWALVQKFWGNTFSDYIADDDVLAGRGGCGNCGCTTACENKTAETH